MDKPNISPEKVSNSAILMAADASAEPEVLAALLSSSIKVAALDPKETSAQVAQQLTQGVSAIALLVSAKSGISKGMIDLWNYAMERQFPRMVIVNKLSMSETDFDEIALIVNRVLEQGLTPYLVLHDEIGEPTGLISLESREVHDYSTPMANRYMADSELQSLIEEFASEYQEQLSAFESDSFSQGLLVPILPVMESKLLGVREIKEYLAQIQ
jgi:translation elongation factor EF-G